MKTIDLDSPCPCSSSLSYADCCNSLITGKIEAETVAQLMRSRFTAFAIHHEAYLLKTWDKKNRPKKITFNKEIDWTSLEVLSETKGGLNDSRGVVQFKAYYVLNGVEQVMNEASRFKKNKGQWFYLDGIVKSVNEADSQQPLNKGLNAPCECGSGKKFKRCCGK